MSIVTLWNVLFAVLREFSVIYSWLIQKTERIQNKYEIERDYIKDKKSQFSVLNLTTTELSFRPFREFSKTECARSLSFFLYLYSIYFCWKFIIFLPGSLRVLFRPILLVAVSFTFSRTFRLIRFLFANSSGSHLARKKFDGFKIRFGQKSAVSRLSELAFIFARFALFHRLCLLSFAFLFSFFLSFFIKFNAGRNNENVLKVENF